MSISIDDILVLANTLVGGANEPEWRSSMSRAYYAAYHGCNDWHDALALPGSNSGPNGGIHQVLINRLSNPDSSIESNKRQISKVLAAKLTALKNKRTAADYDLNCSFMKIDAQNACELAKEILSKL